MIAVFTRTLIGKEAKVCFRILYKSENFLIFWFQCNNQGLKLGDSITASPSFKV